MIITSHFSSIGKTRGGLDSTNKPINEAPDKNVKPTMSNKSPTLMGRVSIFIKCICFIGFPFGIVLMIHCILSQTLKNINSNSA